MKLKRSSRLVDMTSYILNHPHRVVSLTYFTKRYEAAKSSISEDLVIVKENFEKQGIGKLQTIAGASGGVKFIPYINNDEAASFLEAMKEQLSDNTRLLPGGYLYMTDVLGQPNTVTTFGRMAASIYAEAGVDVVMTMETKGIPLAFGVATQLNVPVVIVRKNSRVTEGSTVSINYVSGSSKRIQSMVLSRRSLEPGSRVLVVDDFMKAGGTIRGMTNLIQEFDATVAGRAVLVETKEDPKLVNDYLSMLKLSRDETETEIRVEPGNFNDYFKEAPTDEKH